MPAGFTQAQPSAADALEAFAHVEAWTRSWALPDADAATDPLGAQGACVTLRLDGRTLGRGVWMEASPASEQAPGASVARAFTLALREAQVRAPAPRDALRDDALEQLAQRMTVDVQLAGPLSPIAADTWSDAALALSPGLDGVAARVGERVDAVFPGTMLATNLPPEGALRALAGALDLPPVDLAALRDKHGLSLHRFRVRHAVQVEPASPPIFLHRGGRVQPIDSVGPNQLRVFARELAANLSTRLGAARRALLGPYQPWTGEYDDADEAALAAHALAAVALAQLAEIETGPARERALASTMEALALLFPPVDPAEDRLDPPREAAWLALLALDEARQVDAQLSLAGVNERAIIASLAIDAGDAPLPVAALRALALAAWAQPQLRAFVDAPGAARDDAAAARNARQAVRAVLRDATATGDLTPTMPWLGWAILRASEDEAHIASAAALREHRELLFTHQLTRADLAFEDRDLEGGVVFTQGGAALPTWRTAQAVVFVAMMLGDPRLTESAELPREVIRLLRSIRYLRQLQADDAVMHMFVDGPAARNGIRAALWDQRMPIEATAMTLLAVVETIKSLRDRAADAPVP